MKKKSLGFLLMVATASTLGSCNKSAPGLSAAETNYSSQTGESVNINSVCYDAATDSYKVNVTFAGATPSTQALAVAYYSNDCAMCDPDGAPVRVSTVTKNSNGTFDVVLATGTYGVHGTIRAAIVEDGTHAVLALDAENVSGVACN